jgi:hypothetical protein
MTTETPECRCLNCRALLGAVTGVNNNERPEPGNLTICLRCGAVMLIADDLTARGLTEREMDDLTNNHHMMQYLARVCKTIRFMPKMN